VRQLPSPLAAKEETEATRRPSSDGGEGARRLVTIVWAAACELLYPSGSEDSKAAHGTGFPPPVPRATPRSVYDTVLEMLGAGSASPQLLQFMNTMTVKVEPAAPTRSSPETIARNL